MPDYDYPNYSPWNSQRDKIKKVVIKDGVTSIGEWAFYGCSGLTSLTIPNSVTSIGDYAFRDCSDLTSVIIPNSVTSIGEQAFAFCSSLSSLTIPNSVTSIGKQTFIFCSSLSNLTIPNSVTSIGEWAFAYCSGLSTLTIPNSVTSIGEWAFAYCSGFSTLTIPNSVTSIGNTAFIGCSHLTSIIVEKENVYYDSRSNCNAIIETKSNILIRGCENTIIPNSVINIGKVAFAYCSGLSNLTIPNSVTSIGESAFYECSGLTSVNIPNSVTSIGDYAFYGCKGLNSITIPNSVTSIDNYSFSGCSGLSFVIIPNSVTSIREHAFFSCHGLTSVTIPNSVTNIGGEAFSYCRGLDLIICEASIPPSCYDKCFSDINKSIPVYVPTNSVEQYKVADGWKEFTNIQAIPTTYTLKDGETFINGLRLDRCDISYTRTFNNTAWQALYIPFSLNYADWKDDFEVAYINGVRQLDKDDDGIIDETIMDVIKIKSGSTSPNMPYLIKAKKTGKKTFSVSNTTLYPAEENSVDCSTTIAKYTFTGTYNAIPSATMIANGYYAMGGGDLIQSDGSNDLKPYRWYMKVESRNPSYNASNAAKTITFNVIDEEGETTTGIEELQMTNYKSPVYDLNGRKVNENNLKPGIYVKNGKKFVVK